MLKKGQGFGRLKKCSKTAMFGNIYAFNLKWYQYFEEQSGKNFLFNSQGVKTLKKEDHKASGSLSWASMFFILDHSRPVNLVLIRKRMARGREDHHAPGP